MERYNDDELVYLTRQGCEIAQDYLFKKYQRLIHSLIHRMLSSYQGLRMSHDDLYQILMVTFYRQMDAYREDQNALFSTFMYLVLERRIYSLTRDHQTQKYFIERDMYSFDESMPSYNGGKSMTLSEVIEDKRYDFKPERQLYVKEGMAAIEHILQTEATTLERKVFLLTRMGYSHQEIANMLGCPVRSVGNALYRINHKIKIKKP